MQPGQSGGLHEVYGYILGVWEYYSPVRVKEADPMWEIFFRDYPTMEASQRL